MADEPKRGDGPAHVAAIASAPDGVLADLRHGVAGLERVNAAVRECLGDALGAHVRAAALDEHRVLLHADSPAFAARARYLAPAIAAALERSFGRRAPHRVEVASRPRESAPARPQPVPPAPISAATRSLLLQVADTTGNERLAGVLRRLAERGR